MELQKEKEPYLTFGRIKETRDNLAHNRVLYYSEIISDEKWSFRTKWEDFDTPDKIMPALHAYSDPSRPLIPTQVGHPFRPIPATDSDGNPATILRFLGIGGRHPSA